MKNASRVHNHYQQLMNYDTDTVWIVNY